MRTIGESAALKCLRAAGKSYRDARFAAAGVLSHDANFSSPACRDAVSTHFSR
ncbi:MAG: hypothetical protein ACREH9_00280 [Pseudomonadota bacterium]